MNLAQSNLCKPSGVLRAPIFDERVGMLAAVLYAIRTGEKTAVEVTLETGYNERGVRSSLVILREQGDAIVSGMKSNAQLWRAKCN